MMYARDYRRIGRESLRGFWPTAILAGIVSGLLGASIQGGGGLSGSATSQSGTAAADPYASAGMGNSAIQNFVESDFFMPMMTFLGTLLVLMLIYLVVCIIIGGAVTLGYAQFNLNLVDGNRPRVGDVFCHMNRLWAGFCMGFWRGLIILIWSLPMLFPMILAILGMANIFLIILEIVLSIPSIMATYSYAITPYIYAEHPEMRARDALRESRQMMYGSRRRLFFLNLSFMGWILLDSFVFAILLVTGAVAGNIGMMTMSFLLFLIGLLFLSPYMEASRAAFYREVSEHRYSNPQPEAQWHETSQEPVQEETYDYNNDAFR